MNKKRNFIWVFPILGAIFGIITLILPIMIYSSSPTSWYYWIWGLAMYRSGWTFPEPILSEDAFTNNTQLLSVSIISSTMITIAIISLLIAGISSMRNFRYNKKNMLRTGLGGILLIIGGLVFWVGADWPTTPHTYPYSLQNVWVYFDEGISVYTPFFGAVISLLAIPIQVSYLKPLVEKPAEGEEFSLKTKGTEEKIGMKKYIWVFPLIAAIFGIITFLVPVISWNFIESDGNDTKDWYYWIWGLSSYRYNFPSQPEFVSETAFTNNIQLLRVSIISSIMILVAIIFLIITGFSNKRDFRYSKKNMEITGFSAILLIVGGIIFWVGVDWPTIPTFESTPPFSVWNWFDEGFSIYTPFIGGGIALIGMTMHYITFKSRIKREN